MNFFPWERLDRFYDGISRSKFTTACVNSIATILIAVGVPPKHTPDADDLIISATATIFTLASYWYWLGKNHARRRKTLETDLNKV